MEKMRQWTILTALGVVGVLAAGWFLLVSPQHSHASDLRNQAASEQATTSSLLTQVQQLKQQQKEEPAQQRKLMEIATQIPDNPALPTLIRQLSSAAHRTGVTLDSLAPAPPALVAATAPTATAATTGTSAAAAAAATPSAALAQIQLTVQAHGSYFNLETFFRAVEHLQRAMMVTGFTIGQGPGAASGTTSGTTQQSAGAAEAAPGSLSAQLQAVVFESPKIAAPATTPLTPTGTAPSTAPAQ